MKSIFLALALIATGAGLLNAKLAGILTGYALLSVAGTMLAAIYNNRR